MSHEWVASCRNIADLLTRNKWKKYVGKCSLANRIKEIAREVPWEEVQKVSNSAPVRAEFKDSTIKNTDEFITILRDALKNPESFK